MGEQAFWSGLKSHVVFQTWLSIDGVTGWDSCAGHWSLYDCALGPTSSLSSDPHVIIRGAEGLLARHVAKLDCRHAILMRATIIGHNGLLSNPIGLHSSAGPTSLALNTQGQLAGFCEGCHSCT